MNAIIDSNSLSINGTHEDWKLVIDEIEWLINETGAVCPGIEKLMKSIMKGKTNASKINKKR